jgi:hypothetical protein
MNFLSLGALAAAVSSTSLCLAPAAGAQAHRPYRVTDLGVPIGQNPIAGVGAEGMSPNAEFVAGDSVWVPFVWQRGTGMRALQKLPGYVSAGAISVTDAGIAVGRCGIDTGTWETYQAVWWDPTGVVRSLAQPSWRYSIAVDVNRHHQVLIAAGVPNGSSSLSKAFIGPLSGPMVELVPGPGASAAYDLNDRGQVCLVADGIGDARFTPGIGLQPLPMRPRRLNEYGQVAGFDAAGQLVARYTDGAGVHVFTAAGTFRDVGGIDSFGQIVATEYVRTSVSPPNYAHYGYLMSEALGVRKLDTLVDHPVPVRVGSVVAISDSGAIAASGSVGSDNRAILLEPRFLHVYGQGCDGSNGTVRMVASGDAVGGGRIALLAAGGASGGAGVFALSTRSAAIPLPGGCTVSIDPTASLLVAAPLNPIGQGSLALTLPSYLAAVSLFAQFVSIDAAAANGVLALSNGVRIDIQ